MFRRVRATVLNQGYVGVFATVFAVSSAVVLTVIWQVQTWDDPVYQFRHRFAAIEKLEADWDRQVLLLELGVSQNFDAITLSAREARIGVSELDAWTRERDGLEPIMGPVRDYRQLLEQKVRFSDRIKASHALLKNAASMVPREVADLFAAQGLATPSASDLSHPLDRLVGIVVRTASFAVAPTADTREAIEEAIAELRATTPALPEDLSQAVERFARQASILVAERLRGSEMMLDITAISTGDASDRVWGLLQRLEDTNERRRRMLRYLAVFCSVLAAAAFGALLLSLRQRYDKLDEYSLSLKQAHEDVEEQLMQSSKMSALGQMVAGITHEINTPLAYIRAVFEHVQTSVGENSSLVTDATDDENALRMKRDELNALLDDGLHGLQEISTLIHTMKNFSRLDRGAIVSLSIEEILESVLLIANSQLKYTAVVRRDYGNVGDIEGSASQIRQVFLNIIVNAADAMAGQDRRGTLTLRCRTTRNNMVRVDVIDDGPGIAADVLARIFDPFFTTKPVGKGTGMGLSICYRIVENHGGTMTVKSAEGEGTVVSVILPRHERAKPRSNAKPHSGAVGVDPRPTYAATGETP